MSKKKVCKNCKIFVEGSECPLCKGQTFLTNWQGRIYVVDPKKSQVAQKMGLKAKGEYTIKAR
jgi:DNA-directed RNA polymerase subunit E"